MDDFHSSCRLVGILIAFLSLWYYNSLFLKKKKTLPAQTSKHRVMFEKRESKLCSRRLAQDTRKDDVDRRKFESRVVVGEMRIRPTLGAMPRSALGPFDGVGTKADAKPQSRVNFLHLGCAPLRYSSYYLLSSDCVAVQCRVRC